MDGERKLLNTTHTTVLETLVPSTSAEQELANALLDALHSITQGTDPLVLDDANLLLQVFGQGVHLDAALRLDTSGIAAVGLGNLSAGPDHRLLDLVQQALQVRLGLDELVRALLGVQQQAEQVLQRVAVVHRVLVVLGGGDLDAEPGAERRGDLVEQAPQRRRDVPERVELHGDAAADGVLDGGPELPGALQGLAGGRRAPLGRVLGEEGLGAPQLLAVAADPVRDEHHVAVAVVAVRQQVVDLAVQRLARLEDPLEQRQLLQQLRLLVPFLLRQVRVVGRRRREQPRPQLVVQRGRLRDPARQHLVERHDHPRLEPVEVALLHVLRLRLLLLLAVGFDGCRVRVRHVTGGDLGLDVRPQGPPSLRCRCCFFFAPLRALCFELLLCRL